jgi:hypothetical protein
MNGLIHLLYHEISLGSVMNQEGTKAKDRIDCQYQVGHAITRKG